MRAVDDRTQARLLVHLINKQEAEEHFVRVMAVHGGHLGQPTESMAPEVRDALSAANDWHDRCNACAEQASAALIASMLAHIDETGPILVGASQVGHQ